MRPSVGAFMPVITLKTVVLPAPLGPIRPTISPSSMETSSFDTAVRPPKRMVMPWLLSKAMLPPARPGQEPDPGERVPGELAAAHEPALPEEHHRHEQGREHHHAQSG